MLSNASVCLLWHPARLLLLLAPVLWQIPVLATDPVTAAAEQVIVNNFARWTKAEGGCENIKSFASPYANRGTVEAVLACKALKIGGYDGAFLLVAVPNYERALVEAASGRVSMPAETLWDVDLDKKVFYGTDPLIAQGEFEKGIYVRPQNQHKWVIKTVADLQKLTCVMPARWRVDWNTLQHMKVKTIDVSTKEAIFRMVNHERGDCTLLEFSARADLGNTVDGIRLVPIMGVKVTLDGQRRLAISKKAPHAVEIFNAINRGIAQLRANGSITRAWQESGFLGGVERNWVIIN